MYEDVGSEKVMSTQYCDSEIYKNFVRKSDILNRDSSLRSGIYKPQSSTIDLIIEAENSSQWIKNIEKKYKKRWVQYSWNDTVLKEACSRVVLIWKNKLRVSSS